MTAERINDTSLEAGHCAKQCMTPPDQPSGVHGLWLPLVVMPGMSCIPDMLPMV
jgi:hypothetical protein